MPTLPCPARAAARPAVFCLVSALALAVSPLRADMFSPAMWAAPAAPETSALDAAVADLEQWLDAHAPWPARTEPPRIRVVSEADMTLIAGPPARGQGRRLGVYDPDSQTILLTAPWSVEDDFDLSVLLHELVHHRQAVHHWVCGAAQEPHAYRLQEAWLAEHGQSLDVSWFAITWAAGCTARDIHPD